MKAISSALAFLMLLPGGPAFADTASAVPKMPDPEDGSVAAGAYTNKYFGSSYPLPPGWTEDLIIGTDGQVKHIHVINAFPEQRSSIEQALVQWRFSPYEVNGHPVEVETGIVFEFKPERSN